MKPSYIEYKLSIHDRCLRDDQFTLMARHEPVVQLEIESDFGTSMRGFSLIHTLAGQVYADRVTGTLYNMAGRCLTSSRMKLNLGSKQ
jgi:hypothetical protein